MTTAKALGLDVPTSILLSADERNTATQEDWIADGGNGSFALDHCSRQIRWMSALAPIVSALRTDAKCHEPTYAPQQKGTAIRSPRRHAQAASTELQGRAL